MTEYRHLTVDECYRLFDEYGTPEHVIGHCRAVSDTAVKIGEELNKNGYNFDLELVKVSGLIHDVARREDCHEIVAADMLLSRGFVKESEIVRVHMNHKFGKIQDICETDLVCLSDRLVKEDEYVGIDERIDYLIHKPGENPERTEYLIRAKSEIKKYMRDIEKAIGRTIDSLFLPSLDHLLKQVEKPARYTGNEINCVIKNHADVDITFAFAFPDLYEIGMSYMGLQIIYNVVNHMKNAVCERVLAPAADMEDMMRKYKYPLFTLESKTPVRNMDIFGFTLQYEMSFTNILNMLELAKIPIQAKERDDSYPVVIAGGPCAFNPEPLADFIDIFLIGDGEELLPNIIKLVDESKKYGWTKRELFKECCKLEGVYIPSFYEPVYAEDGRILKYKKLYEGAPDKVKKAMIHDLNTAIYPTENIVPLIETVHDRAVVETFRGCTRGCRFCQAGMIYRPIRERKKDSIMKLAANQLKNTGHDELSILSLSTSDYSEFESLAIDLTRYCKDRNVSLSLPSLRLDNFSFKVLDEIQGYKKSGLTFAPEAGTQRLRDVINKGITEDDIYDAVEQAIELGWRHVKLYFMIGLPTETEEDFDGIAEIAKNIIAIHKKSGRGGRFNVTVSVSNFVPKAHTPFQWFGQNSTETFTEKHNYLAGILKIKNVNFNYHDDAVSTCEAIFAKGDRRMGELLVMAHDAGCKFDGWSEFYNRDIWNKLLHEWKYDYKFYVERHRDYDECLPWDIIDSGVTKKYLKSENEKAMGENITPDCRYGCTGCGINKRTTCRQGGMYV